jgi:Cu+-exporting ATPase
MVSVRTACERDKVFKATGECAAESCISHSEAQSAQIHKPKEIPMSSTTVVKDPVCGMDVDTSTAAGHTDHAGQTYHFCGSKCKEKFDHSPAQYMGKSTAAPKTGHGCCG